MKRKLRVAVICGGKSVEHEISLQSAKNVIEAMDREKYDIVLIGIDKDGRWHLKALADFEEEMEGSLLPHLTSRGDEV
ncbi:MAG: D-alanine--D-alanine ligase A, partial [Atribacterota bacterium]|nr:D-alanine--D-alanine ligase A [Atribacterota bacterium]